MGQTGPAARLAGYGYHAAAICGFYEITGWDDRPPAGPFNAYTDTIAPRFLAATLMAALDHRRRTGEGQYIDQAQMESSLYFLAPELLDHQVSGRMPRRAGNDVADGRAARRLSVRRRGRVVRDRGRNRCAVARAATSSGRSGVGGGGRARHRGRATRAARRDRRPSSPSSRAGTSRATLMDSLQAAGVPAGMVQRSSDHMEDPQLAPPTLLPPA